MKARKHTSPSRSAKPSRSALKAFCKAALATGLMKDLNKSMIAAVVDGNAVVVQTLLDVGADVHASTNKDWVSHDEALCRAADDGDWRMIKILLAAGADVHVDGDYPLCQVSSSGHIKALRVLLAAGADVHAMDSGVEDQPLLHAVEHRQLEAVKVLVAAGSCNLERALRDAWAEVPVANQAIIEVLTKAIKAKRPPAPR